MHAYFEKSIVINIISIWTLYHLVDSVSNSQLTVSVDENTSVGSKIISLKDELKLDDKKINSTVTFLPITSNYFSLSKNGDIFIKNPLDRDSDPKLCLDTGFTDVCSITCVVWLSNTDIITVRIVINDLNDNKPFWSDKNLIIPVAENSPLNMEIDIPLAVDKDTNSNGIEKYRLVNPNSNEFELITHQSPNGIIPKLIIKKSLDREERQSYNLTVEAIDGSPPYHTGSVVLLIVIADQNDNNPVFEKDIYRVKIKENYPLKNDLPIHPKATDKDENNFGKIAYSFSIATTEYIKNIFEINESSGRISVIGQIDYDNRQHSFDFIIVASDFGTPSLSATAKVSIEIEDVNDQAPTITIQYVGEKEILTIEENHPPNKLITTVAVADTDTGLGGLSNCSLGLANSFSLQYYKPLEHIKVYQLISIRVFDRETEPVIHTQVICQDHGSPRQISRKLITVNILDVNDCTPRFDKLRYKFRTKEENPPNYEVGKIEASDADSGVNGEIEFFVLAPDNTRNMFFVTDKGQVFAKQRLDREVFPYGFKFKVIAKDKGTPYLNDSVEVEIELTDINDCKPKFSKTTYKYAVVENDGPNANTPSTLGKLEATDGDIGINSKRTFRLMQPHDLFEVTEDGYVKVTGILNRELNSFYSLQVLVIDSLPTMKNRNSATATITITVSDINDNPPIFVNSVNISVPIHISYKEELSTEVHRIFATDADTGINAIIDYSIRNDNFKMDYFTINPKSGSITVTRRLSKENIGKYNLIIVACDNGQPKQSSEMILKIEIDDSVPRSYQAQVGYPGSGRGFLLNNNRLIIIIVVTATVLVCIILIGVFCAMTYCKSMPYSRTNYYHNYNGENVKPMGGLAHSCLTQYDPNSSSINKYSTDINESLLPPSSFYLINNQPLINNDYGQQQQHMLQTNELYDGVERYNNVVSPYGKPTPSDSMEFGETPQNNLISSPMHTNHGGISSPIHNTQSHHIYSPTSTIMLQSNHNNNNNNNNNSNPYNVSTINYRQSPHFNNPITYTDSPSTSTAFPSNYKRTASLGRPQHNHWSTSSNFINNNSNNNTSNNYDIMYKNISNIDTILNSK